LRRWSALIAAFGAGAPAAPGVALARPRPTGVAGSEAEDLAHRLVAAVDGDAWERTGAVRWTMPNGYSHLWDRRRNLDRVDHGRDEILIDLSTHAGRALHDGAVVADPKKLLDRAYAAWVNDSFWLNPVVKAFDDGTSRQLVADADGAPGVLVTYSTGGLTPGDAYLWEPGPDGRPAAWRMWVSVLPIGGIRVTWDGWQQLATGAWVSTVHRWPFFTFKVSDVAGAADLSELSAEDPFASIAGP
jgi:hypothetical protein